MAGAIVTEYTVVGMTCGHCESAVREEVSAVPGVTSLEVSATSGVLRVTSESELDDQVVIQAVDEAGYEASRA